MKLSHALFLFAITILTISNAQDLELELFVSNLDRPVSIKHAGDERLFVVEQDGLIKIINSDGSAESTPFLNIDSRVINTGNERGLLGLAFHPDYSTNGYFFINYNNNSGNTVISRFSRDATNPSIADPNSELIILTYNQPFSNHNGGDLAFGMDGYLYISSGDGGSGGDPQGNAQNKTNLLGNILRVDINSTTGSLNYTIPSDNPFVGDTSGRDEIWAYGLRNPWKFSFDRSNGEIWIGDVGQGEYEEINTASATEGGINYGWRCYEGSSVYDNSNCPNAGALRFPVSEYSHSNDGEFKCSITGGYRYRGAMYPNFDGFYFFADYCSGEIGFIELDNGTWTMTLEDFNQNWVAFGEDINGELLISSISGDIYKLVDTTLSVGTEELSRILIYPNPAKDELNINFTSVNIESILSELYIYDFNGKIVKTIKRTAENLQKINTSDLSTGIYILEIKSDTGEQNNYKLVIN